MDLRTLFAALDADPFRPFTIERMSGRRIPVRHPENAAVLPNRQAVHPIEVYRFDPWDMAMIYPEGAVALLFNGRGKNARRASE